MLAQTLLIVAPHPDDEVIGAGALAITLTQAGGSVSVVCVSDGEFTPQDVERRRAEAQRAIEALGAKEVVFFACPTRAIATVRDLTTRLAKEIQRIRPDIIAIPHMGESDTDHEAVHRAGREAAFVSESAMLPGGRPAPPATIIGYEVWSPISRPALTIDFDIDVLRRKRVAAEQYVTEAGRLDIGRAIEGLAAYRGTMHSGGPWAEAYTLERGATMTLPGVASA